MMDVSNISHSGLHLLKKNDPFLYYSIPSAIMTGVKDLNEIIPSLHLGTSERPQNKEPPSPKMQSSSLVRRRSRISYEYYPDVITGNTISDQMTELCSRTAKRRRSSHEKKSSPIKSNDYNSILFQDTLFDLFNGTLDKKQLIDEEEEKQKTT